MNAKIVDIRDKICPMTTVHVRLALDKTPTGSRLDILLSGEETLKNVEILLKTLGQSGERLQTGAHTEHDYTISLSKQ